MFKSLQDQRHWRRIVLILLLLSVGLSVLFVNKNHEFYTKSIAELTELTEKEQRPVSDRYGNEDIVYEQTFIGEVKNNEHKGKEVVMTTTHSASGANDHAYEVGDDVFIAFERLTTEDGMLQAEITDLKRDKYMMLILWVFIIVLLVVGRRQGLFASLSLGINMAILSFTLDFYLRTDMNLLWLSAFLVIVFTILSLLMVNGFHAKTYAAIIATLLGTFAALLITVGALWLTSSRGLYYEEMEFLTRPYRMIFISGLFIGSLGAVMDVAISISSALFELYHQDKDISDHDLKEAGLEIGRDIMGTMTNILFFAYISGSIPMLILYLRNFSEIGYTLAINVSLELARALAGGIGIVITIPIGLYVTLYFIRRKRVSA